MAHDHDHFHHGREADQNALKTALAYHRARGEGSRFRLIGRERGYHGSGFGGVSTGGIVASSDYFEAPLAPSEVVARYDAAQTKVKQAEEELRMFPMPAWPLRVRLIHSPVR